MRASFVEPASRPRLSFEFFPPRGPLAEPGFWAALQKLTALRPAFVSVTQGADGSARDLTLELVARISNTTDLVAVPHQTCIGATRREIRERAREYWLLGVRHIVALRGDPPAGNEAPFAAQEGLSHANELVTALRDVADFEISVAGYPERHPESRSWADDIAHLKAKCDAGASRIITQFFFDADAFLRFRDRCLAAGIRTPIAPGILPIVRLAQVRHFASRCGATVPRWVERRLAGAGDRASACHDASVDIATRTVSRLVREGIEHLHWYTLNRAELCLAICERLGLRQPTTAKASAERVRVRASGDAH